MLERLFECGDCFGCGDWESGRVGCGYDSLHKFDGLSFSSRHPYWNRYRRSSNEFALSGRKEITLIFIKQKRDRGAERWNRDSTILL